ncbi:hypothetical protein ACFFKE_14310 [Streptomyces mutabilis]|uniref:hypothetical protein n=1 Tax=Streptomyces mutabilis TaxID=67332 RepID=UPI0035ED8198
MDFVPGATVARGLAENDWYLTSVQAGFERPWSGHGTGLTVNIFPHRRDGGTRADPIPGPGDPGGCEVERTARSLAGRVTADDPSNGRQHRKRSAVDDWAAPAFTRPLGPRRITNAWKRSPSPTSARAPSPGPAWGTTPGSRPRRAARRSAARARTSGHVHRNRTGFSLNGTPAPGVAARTPAPRPPGRHAFPDGAEGSTPPNLSMPLITRAIRSTTERRKITRGSTLNNRRPQCARRSRPSLIARLGSLVTLDTCSASATDV